MAFIITHSSIEDDAPDGGMGDKLIKLTEPRIYRATDEEKKELNADKGTHFKLYDDDGNCYYTGKYLGDPDAEEAFEPLNWAERHAGCTYIKYRQPNGKYEVL